MKKLLFLSSRLPYPPIGGDRLKSYWLLKILSKHFKVHLVSLTDTKAPKEFYEWAKEIGLSYKIFQKRKRQFYFNSLKGLMINKLPLQVNYYYFKEVQDYINELYKGYDLLFSTLIRTASYIINKEKPKILEMTDSIGLNYLRSANQTSSLKWKAIYSIESKRLLQFEERCIQQFDITLFVNKEERDHFNLTHKTEWLPNGVNEDLLAYEKRDMRYRNHVAFFGKMDYQPNIDAVLWFVRNVLPNLNNNIKFIVVGAYPKKAIRDLPVKFKNIEVTGFVEDPYLILKSSLCIVAPMQTGGGIQNKILECMALGTINVLSSLAAKPIVGAQHDKHFLVYDKAEEIASLINRIYRNPKEFDYLKFNCKEFVKNNFTWGIYERKLICIINSVFNKGESY